MSFSRRIYRQFVVTIETDESCSEVKFNELARKTKEFIEKEKDNERMGEVTVRTNF